MMNARLILSNRQENLKLLKDHVRKWAGERGLPPNRLKSLEKSAEKIFLHLVTHAYQPGQAGSIALTLEEKGPRLRLTFEDDAAPPNRVSLNNPVAPEQPTGTGGSLYNKLQQLAESLVYYRTADRKNRLVVFLA